MTTDRCKRFLVVVPTYNELENIKKLIKRVEEDAGSEFDILFVDDNSPDGTGKLIEDIKKTKSNIFIIHRKEKMGLGSAYLEGFRYGVLKNYDGIFEMDADLSHPPEYLKTMVAKLNDSDIVIGSRFRSGLKNINKTPLRILISIIAARYMRAVLGLGCSDPMGGFTAYRKNVLEAILNSHFFAKGYLFQAEIKYKCKMTNFKAVEIPIIFKNRDWGSSKISKKDMLEALTAPWKIRFSRKK